MSLSPFDQALHDYYFKNQKSELTLHNSYGDPEKMPTEVFFREESDLSELELIAMDFADGDILDIGAGVGAHAKVLQESGKTVTALEISIKACEIMSDRGITNVLNKSFYEKIDLKFDTILLLMNGFGLCGKVENIPNFLNALKGLLRYGGKVLVDSSDVAYMYDELPKDPYYGEVAFCYEYKHLLGEWFNWLYIDKNTLIKILNRHNWSADILFEDDYDQYLAVIKPDSYE